MEDSVIALRPYMIGHRLCFDRAEFEIVRNSILKHLLAYGTLTTDRLSLLVENHLKYKFDGSLHRHYEAVRQVLEARGEIRCVSRHGPPQIEIAG
ncbi:MAG TPA: hypothetical protein VKE92_08635 [Anaerolineales bacterium]|jgi:hypothetical protein|nr:hypothetical protein [Anaerolineales bacterium]